MRTFARIVLICLGVGAALWAGSIVLGVALTILHYAFIAAVLGGIGYAIYAIASPNRSLTGRTRILP